MRNNKDIFQICPWHCTPGILTSTLTFKQADHSPCANFKLKSAPFYCQEQRKTRVSGVRERVTKARDTQTILRLSDEAVGLLCLEILQITREPENP